MATPALKSYRALLLVGALLTFSSLMPKSTATKMSDGSLSPATDLYNNTNMKGICKSIDIRNTLKSFDNLNGCRVVEGFVQILLFDNVNESAFNNISFPLLTEITDFLLLYRVNGLRSIGQLFPNLSVIRGQDNVFQYSLVIYEMSSLQEIGLYSLTDIMAGLIRIDKNPSLCYVNSIDWDLIAHEKGEHFIKSVKAENECPLCPGDDGITDALQCPPSTNKNNMGRYLCWNRQHCQKVCPKECNNNACDSEGRCCDEKCLGGCNNNNGTQCHVCRKFSGFEEGQCLLDCPSSRYEYLGRRCIKREECINTKRPLKLHSKIQHEFPYKIYNNSCLLECPSDFMDDYVTHTCVPCSGRCKKVCQGTVIDSIESAQQLRGCTHINGSLEIQIRGGKNVVNALEENLNMIEEIDGYIKVVRSFPLVSLNFLKKLKVIRGNSLENQKYVFVVLDNQHLQEIWNWTNRTLKIDRGRLFFHFNPKLCIDKIKKLRENANLEDFNDLEVAPNSNGDKTACNVKELIVNVTKKHSKSLVLKWSQFDLRDHRKLLGYLIYSIEAPDRNVTLYDGRDACGGDGWRVDDVQVQNNPTYLLSQLKPYTQYAYYVKTYTVASETSGAQSRIEYERTLPYQPSLPIDIKIDTIKSYDSLEISWKPPLQPNGNVTYYIVTGVNKTMERGQILKDRNYCNFFLAQKRETQTSENKSIYLKQNNTCDCGDGPDQDTDNLPRNEERINQIEFEDELINFVYVKRAATKDSSRRKRSEPITFPNSTKGDPDVLNNESDQVANVTDMHNRFKSFKIRVNGSTRLVVNNLIHYTNYEIKIEACREKEGDDDNQKNCSEKAHTFARTQMKVGANQVLNINTNQSMRAVTITWDEPSDPNGCIVAYRIEYGRVDINSHPIIQCVSASEYLNSSKKYTVKNLNPGNYSLRIAAWSQADNPLAHETFSQYKYFLIEEESSQQTVWIVIMTIIIFVVIFGVGYFVLQKRYAPDQGIKLLNPSVNPEYVSTVYEPDEWEVHRDKIKLIKELGQGSFGMVYEGAAKDIKGKAQTRCAIKTVNEHATNRERIEFLNEASVMKAFDTAHVVRLLGVVSQGQPTLVVMELMANGDLKSYLRSHRPDIEKGNAKQPPTLRRILQMAIEIADGMAYLAAKKFVHRDLAARNCMVAEDLTVKIGDFGMTRDIYETDYYRKGTKGLLPVRWMAPESLRDGLFSSSSDVWSYGVVLWEMATLASQPYQGLSNDQVLRYVIDGGIMERPENCPDKLYDLMICCWRHNPSDRPTFLHLCSMLLEDASQTFSQISFYHSTAGMEARNSKPVQNNHQDDPSTPLRRNRIGLDSSEDSDPEELEANGYVSNGTMP